MSEVQTPRVEMEARPGTDMPALQARMLLRDTAFLNPANEAAAPLLSKETVGAFHERSYGLYEKASATERRDYWNRKTGEGASFDARFQTWSADTVKCFTSEKNQATVARLAPLLAKIGMQGTFTADSARTIYNRYLDNATEGSGMKSFVADVLDSYRTAGKLDRDAMMRDREAITWMANIFGATSSEVVEQLFAAEAALEANPACFDELNVWVNKVTAPEKRLMEFIWNGTQIPVEDTVRTDEPPTIEPPRPPGTREPFPVEAYRKRIQEALLNDDVDTVVVSAGTGTGKTTQIPQFVAEILRPNERDKGEKIAVTQPRRLATEELAKTIAGQMGTEVGKRVGYKHGLGKRVSKETEVLLTVEGSLLRAMANDPLLREYNYVMVDEWHERHKQTDLLVAALQRAQKLRREQGLRPLKMLITSATMDREGLTRQLGPRTISFEVKKEEGKSYRIDEVFEKPGTPAAKGDDELTRRAAEAAKDMIMTRKGRNLIIFMPGDRLITKTHEAISALNLPGVKIDSLIGSMTREEQEEAIAVNDGMQHIIIATPIAETSLTVPRADVISSGLVNVPRTDPATGLTYLEEVPHSLDGLMQQRGRTGRESDGMFRFLGTEEEFRKSHQRVAPEIVRMDITDEVLLLRSMGLELDDLDLVDKKDIPEANKTRAKKTLRILGALKEDGTLTDMGKRMAEIPLDYHYSRMMVEAERLGCAESAATIAVLAAQNSLYKRKNTDTERDAVRRKQQEFQVPDSDFLSLLRMYRTFQDVGKGEHDNATKESMRRAWADDHDIRYETLVKVGEERRQLLEKLHLSHITHDHASDDAIRRAVFEGFRDMLMVRDISAYTMVHEPVVFGVKIDKYSPVQAGSYQYIIAAGNNPRIRKKDLVVMQTCQGVNSSWI